MNRPSTARDALIIEAIGEVAALIDRLEAVAPALDASRRALVQAGEDIAGQVAAFESRMAAITENANVPAVRHIARRTDDMAQTTIDLQARAMGEAARALFRNELGPALRRLSVPLQHLAERCAGPCQRWLAHVATALLSAAGSAWLVYLLVGR